MNIRVRPVSRTFKVAAERRVQKHASEFSNTRCMTAGLLWENDVITAIGKRPEVVMAHARALVYGDFREEVVLVSEDTGLLEYPL